MAVLGGLGVLMSEVPLHPKRGERARRCLGPLSSRFPTAYSLRPTPYALHPTAYTLHPTPYTLQPTPFIIHPTTHTLHHAAYIIHHTLYTLHPTPYTRNLTHAAGPDPAVAAVPPNRCQAQSVHATQSGPDSGLDLAVTDDIYLAFR